MRRALILITTLTLLTFGCGWRLDKLQHDTALRYLGQLEAIRQDVLAGDMDAARTGQAYLHALWQHDAHWLNCLIDHHHTRDVEGAMLRLSTALEQEDRLFSLLLLDEAMDALAELAERDLAAVENIL